ncbi:MAG: hypothetical protein H7A53_02445 [Akkermansiaceae bacterium]|nr:hypothetical protein [Akkermansiaceae bacterium]MCP5549744.1 hypothetical protein [Akkermansiaceae bacterium]
MSDPNASAGAPPALPTWKSAPADAAMLLGLLAGLNWVVSRDDPGWLGLNPTPWILLPLFLGGRYGLAAALIGSVLAAGAILGLTWAVEGWAAALAAPSGRPFFFLSLLIAGAVGSTIHHLVSGPLRRVHRHATELAAKNRELAEESALYRENESLLQESLLLWGADYASLTEEAHRLFSADARRLDDALLGVLRRVFGVTGAAVYRTGRAGDEEESLPRVAHSGGGEGLPDRISREESGTVWGEALRSRRLVTCREIWESAEAGAGSPENGAVLAAIPWRAGAGDAAAAAVLVIDRMEFSRIRWETLARIEALFAWVMSHAAEPALEGAGGDLPAPRILAPEVFGNRLDSARRVADVLRLPARLILFTPVPNAGREDLARFVEQLRHQVRPVDCLGAIGGNQGGSARFAIALLAPLAKSEAAEAYAGRLLSRMGDLARVVEHSVLDLAEAAKLSPAPATEPNAAPSSVAAAAAAPPVTAS